MHRTEGTIQLNCTEVKSWEDREVVFEPLMIVYATLGRGFKEKGQGLSQHHPSNWFDADEDDNEGEDSELCVQSTPTYYEEQ